MALSTPERPIVVFGDGAQARASKILRNIVEEDGTEVTEFWLLPTPEMKAYYRIPEDELTADGEVIWRCPEYWYEILNIDPGMSTILVFVTFTYSSTRLIDNKSQLQEIERLQVAYRQAQGEIANLREKLKLATQRFEEHFKENLKLVEMAKGKRPLNQMIPEEYEQEMGEAEDYYNEPY